jgi:hypothetical protein
VPKRIEPPEWYRVFHAEDWDEPDAEELRMTAGLEFLGYLHDHHSRRRWHEAQHAYRQAHPLLAEQEFQDIIARRAKRRAG